MFSLRIGLLAEGGFPFAAGESPGWCDRLVRGLAHHEFDVFAFAVDAAQEASGLVPLPPQVRAVHVAPLWRPAPGERRYGRAERRRFAEHFAELAGALAAGGAGEVTGRESGQDRFASGLYGLAELARDAGGPGRALREEQAVRILERACRAPGAHPVVQGARVVELLAVAAHLDRALRPLGAGWYGDGDGGAGLAGADLCHALSGGPAALPGLLAHRFFGTPLLVTEYGVRLRRHYLESGWGAYAGGTVTVRTLVAAFHRRLAAEAYAMAALVTPGNAHARRWALRLGAEGHRLRTVYPGMDAARFAEVAEPPAAGDDSTLVWAGRIEPAGDLIALLHAFAEIRREEPAAHLVVAETGPPAAAHAGYRDHCRALAAQLFPDEAADAHAVGASPVSFEEIGDPALPDRAAAYAAGGVTVLSSVVAGFPVGLVEAMLCGRATVSTDVGAVREVIGGTGLVVPPRNPRALADACLALLRDPARRARLGAAARARAVELFTAEQNVDAFGSIYLELASHGPARATPHPFAHPPEAYLAAAPAPDADRAGAGPVLEGADR
ncbi:DUF3492 domain-containing protein [Streptomyces sp. CMB-StM0423]|uniref:DUF3492 domain-containing protein n=1 Tax=Streptomyces sp. CMB-StM0423 TaxID=2059884 RepID=UPI000C702DB6|nr:DUF3492 domain-containing protein [Streptomyces sp. CMB-StM0423]AUH40766.1 transferase [Streptomyces sp. CMB-StM0423]